ncbi:MAG: hypothetical protein AB1649_08470 [Chloroflexota bacterium]
MRKSFWVLILVLFLTACGSQGDESQEGFQPRNPKTADVQIENNVVTIKIPDSDPYFHLVKISDESVPYTEIQFKYDNIQKTFLFKTDLEDWKPVPADENLIQMGEAEITLEGKAITITYPSGTWAFP